MQQLLAIEEFLKQGLLQEGAWFKLTLDQQVDFRLARKDTGVGKTQKIYNAEDNQFFRYVKEINAERGLQLLGEPGVELLSLRGYTGYKNCKQNIQTFCEVKYGTEGEISARSITAEEQEILPESFKYGQYWLPKTYFSKVENVRIYGVFYAEGKEVDKDFLQLEEDSYTGIERVRPVISLYGANVKILVDNKHNGKKQETAYEIVAGVMVTKKVSCAPRKVEIISQKEFIQRNLLQEGCWFRLTLDDTVSTKLDKSLTGYSKDQDIKNVSGETCLFRYTRKLHIFEKLTLLGEPSEYTVYLNGRKSYDNGSIIIQKACEDKYGIQGKIEARSIAWEEYDELSYELREGEYWLPEKYASGKVLGQQCVLGKNLTYLCLYKEKYEDGKPKKMSGCDCLPIRPVIYLASDKVKIAIGEDADGRDMATPYEIVIEE